MNISPSEFWAMTNLEFMSIIDTLEMEASPARQQYPTLEEAEDLMRRFPDEP